MERERDKERRKERERKRDREVIFIEMHEVLLGYLTLKVFLNGVSTRSGLKQPTLGSSLGKLISIIPVTPLLNCCVCL